MAVIVHAGILRPLASIAAHVETTSVTVTMAPSLNELDARLRALREQLGSSRHVLLSAFASRPLVC